jgi:hypothetical protein
LCPPPGARQLRVVDLWVLLALVQQGGKEGAGAEALLKRRLMEGGAAVAWLERGLVGHEVCVRTRVCVCVCLCVAGGEGWEGTCVPCEVCT